MLKVTRPSLAASRRYKVLVLGANNVGKTAAIQKILSNKFSENSTVPTLGSELFLKEETFKNEKTTLYIWDCSGADRYRPMLQQLYTNEPVKGVILMYDMTNEKSFQELQYWHNEILRCCPSASVLLVGTKSDLSDRLRLTSDDGAKQAKEWSATHLTISSKTGQNCEGMFTFLLALMKKTQT